MKNRKNLVGLVFLASLLAAGAASPAVAQGGAAWPNKPVRIIVPYPAGGIVDIQARAVAMRMSTDLGQAFIIEPKPGANGNIAAENVANAAPDGYTLIVSAPFIINNPLIEKDLRWKAADFTPVARFSQSPSYLLVPANSQAKSVRDYVAMAKASPGLSYGDAGTGTTQSMASEMLKAVAGIKIEAVLYKGAPPVIPDLVNGLITMAVIPSLVSVAPVKDGKLRMLANMSDKRSPAFPDVPTIGEAGYPEATVLSWYGFHAPAGTPRDIVRRISAAVGAASATQEVQERVVNAGGESAFLGGDEFVDFLKEDTLRWARFASMFAGK